MELTDILELCKKHGASIEIAYTGFGNSYKFIVRKKKYENSVILYDIDVMRDYGFEFLKQIEMMIRDIEIYISKKENSDESDT